MRQYGQILETHERILVGGTLRNRAALETSGVLLPTEAARNGLGAINPGGRDCVTMALLLKIEAQLPNVAASSVGLRAFRDRLTKQISEAKELRSRFPDSFLHDRISAVLPGPLASAETAVKSRSRLNHGIGRCAPSELSFV